MSSTNYIAKPVLTARDAIASHVRWKITLLLAARLRESLSPRATRSLRRPEECSIRKWLLSSNTQHLRATSEYRAALQLHTVFHGQMLEIANLLNSGEFDQADRLLNSPEHFLNAANSLANAIMALDRTA